MKNLFITAIVSLTFVSCSGVTPAPELSIKTVDEVIASSNVEVAMPAHTIESKFEIVKELPYFKEMIKIADCVYELKEFQDEVKAIKSFGNTRDNGGKVLERMLSSKKAMLRHYKATSAKVLAYTVRDEVYFNSLKNRSIEENVNTAVHERLHVLGYRHISRFNIGRSRDNAYVIGKIAEKHAGKCK